MKRYSPTLNVIIPTATAFSPTRIGSQSCAMIYHFTRIEFLLKETEHKACPSTDINSLLNGLGLVFDLYILPYKPHCFACLRLQTLTLAPVSVMTFVRELLIITSILQSPLY